MKLHHTIHAARVLAALEPGSLQASFLSWVSSISEKLSIELIHIDGKKALGSYDRREEKLKALHSMSAWSSEHGLVLGQQKMDGKSNEITVPATSATVAQSQRGGGDAGCDGQPSSDRGTN